MSDNTGKEPRDFELFFGKHKGKTLGEVPEGYVSWLASEKFEPSTDWAKELQGAARKMLGQEEESQEVPW